MKNYMIANNHISDLEANLPFEPSHTCTGVVYSFTMTSWEILSQRHLTKLQLYFNPQNLWNSKLLLYKGIKFVS